MKGFSRPVTGIGLLLVMLMLPLLSHARCTREHAMSAADSNSAMIPFGRINMTDTYLQPVGTLLASTVVPPTSYTYASTTAATVLWECDKSDYDAGNVYFLAATNGDDRVGGYFETGATDGLSGVYATWFQYVGIKQSMAGVTLSRYWQKIPLTTYAEAGDKIQIRLQDIPPLIAKLYKISTLPPDGEARTDRCLSNLTTGSATAAGRAYTCDEPNSYIQLVGPNLIHDEMGEDSATNYAFFTAYGIGYGMEDGSSLSVNATCVARSATPLVIFPTTAAQQLNNGVTSQAHFNVQIECSNTATSGTASGQTAIGIQVSNGAYSAAQSLGLVNAAGGVTALVSDNYGNDPTLAKGVGITLQNAGTGSDVVFVGQPGMTGSIPSGNPSGPDAGWYPVLEGATEQGATQAGYTRYTQSYTATLRRLTGLATGDTPVTAGKVHATAYVLVKLQ